MAGFIIREHLEKACEKAEVPYARVVEHYTTLRTGFKGCAITIKSEQEADKIIAALPASPLYNDLGREERFEGTDRLMVFLPQRMIVPEDPDVAGWPEWDGPAGRVLAERQDTGGAVTWNPRTKEYLWIDPGDFDPRYTMHEKGLLEWDAAEHPDPPES